MEADAEVEAITVEVEATRAEVEVLVAAVVAATDEAVAVDVATTEEEVAAVVLAVAANVVLELDAVASRTVNEVRNVFLGFNCSISRTFTIDQARHASGTMRSTKIRILTRCIKGIRVSEWRIHGRSRIQRIVGSCASVWISTNYVMVIRDPCPRHCVTNCNGDG